MPDETYVKGDDLLTQKTGTVFGIFALIGAFILYKTLK